jgi:hypothetical protein
MHSGLVILKELALTNDRSNSVEERPNNHDLLSYPVSSLVRKMSY